MAQIVNVSEAKARFIALLTTIGQAAPTPGGLGAVEAALAAGLTAAGLDGVIAVSAVLLFRLVTFWLPTVPGYFAFNWLTKKGAL